ncbi:MAG: amino acid adenylation domain-containing protein [Xanthobacteraceae bacterium]
MQSASVNSDFGAGIAIIGMGCILPGGVDSPEALWQLLCNARDAITEVPASRWTVDTFFDPDPGTPGKTATRWGGFVDNVDGFDASFFGISPREAAVMDPQQRMLLETTWRALEDAGLQVGKLAGSRTGVYVGISHSDYHGIQKFGRFEIDVHTSTGGALSIAANRLSHRFDLRGPSLSIDTACSSSLVALDIACNALRSGECEMALVGGVNAILTPDVTITFSRASMLSPDGRCKAFDSRANGYVRGEGAGMVVLKPVTRAIADGDRIHAVIRGTAVNQDGRTTTITVPSLHAQVAMLREVCRRGMIDPSQVGYVEAHGTGTPVGDPIEAEAIGTVFGARRAGRPCLIGSIKTNIGHLEPAAGVAGLMKAALCVEHGQIPGNLHFKTVNPNIRMSELGIEVCQGLVDFPNGRGPLVAAVNSFGFGGTNACAIVQQQQPARRKTNGAPSGNYPVLLPLSAASKTALEAKAGQLAETIDTETALADTAGTLSLRRSHLDHRAAVIARSTDEATGRLRGTAKSETGDGLIYGRRGVDPRVVFVFTGQGAQWWGMGRGLLERDPLFRTTVESCDAVFQKLSGWSLVEQLMRPQEDSRMDQTIVAQPTTFALQVGLAALWKTWGVEPAAVVGHSIGEMAAAYTAGALSLEDAVHVVYHRSRLQELARFQGGMAAVGMSAADAGRFLHEEQFGLEIAAINSPDVVTIAGDKGELDRMLAHLASARAEVFARRLRVDYAFHTRQMDPFEDELRRSLEAIASHTSEVKIISTVTGKPVQAGELNAEYWWRNMREPVMFHAAIDAAVDDGFNTFVEVGAHPVLAGPVRSILAARGKKGVVVASLDREKTDEDFLAGSLAELYVNGVELDWTEIAPKGWNFIQLPRHPFEKTSFWAESEEARSARFDHPVHPLLGFRLKTGVPRWQAHFNADMPRFLGDHRVDGTTVFPAAGYVELCLAAARETLGPGPWEIESIAFHDALILTPNVFVVVETSVDPERGKVAVLSRTRGEDGDWTCRATARIRAWSGREPVLKAWHPKLEPPAHFEQPRFYRQLRQEGHEFGPAFQGVRLLWREHAQSLGLVTLPPEAGTNSGYLLHPSILDGCFQIIRGFRDFQDKTDGDRVLALPVSIDRLRFFRSPGESAFSRATAVKETPTHITADISIISQTGEIVAAIEGFCCQRVSTSKKRAAAAGASLYQERWIAQPKLDAEGSAAAPDLSGQSWLLLADRGGVAERLAKQIAAYGGEPVFAFVGQEFRITGPQACETTPDAEGLRRVLAELAPAAGHVVHLWALDASDSVTASAGILNTQVADTEALIALVQAAAERPEKPKVHVMVSGAVALDAAPALAPLAVLHASILGAARTIANELPDLSLRVLDIEPGSHDLDALFAELAQPDAETEVAYRGRIRYVCRVERASNDQLPFTKVNWTPEDRTPPFHVTMTAPGVLDNLILREIPPIEPQPGEALIEVHAAGLNFRDVMAATGLLPPEAEEQPAWRRLGFECAGVVRAVGEGGDPALIGKRVVAVSSGCFASHIAVNTALVFPIPDKFSFVEAAALPTAYVTAQYSLVTLGRMRRGERVLVHAAAGGVGLAAVSIAQKHGAEIFATAGSPEKHDFLRRMGVKHIFDSRSLSFADDIMAATDGYGVDLVLNSLPGAFLEKSLSLLAPGGRFLEIGKRDIYADTPIGLKSFRKNISFFAVDLARLALERPDSMRSEIETILSDIDQGSVTILPITEFPMSEAPDAFRHMAKARQIGKIVVSYDSPTQVETSRTARDIVRPDATYLVTGGLGGFGLAIAEWLGEQGARSLVLVGRSGATREEAIAALERMRATGVDVLAVAADVADRAQLADVMSQIAARGKPLRGVIHAAGVIDDAMVTDLDVDRIRRVFEPKVAGAWNLHELTRELPLDFFVLLSSVAGIIGAVGQAHYAGANRTLDAIAAHRQAQGLPALSIAWGAIAEAGFLDRRQDVARYLEQTGIRPIPLKSALQGLSDLIGRACSSVVFADVQWATLARASPALAATMRLSAFAAAQASDDGKSGHYLRSRLLSLPENARTPFIETYVRDQVGSVLKVSPQTVELDRALNELGLDSLTSFELKNRVEAEIGASLPIGKFLQRPTARDLAAVILERLESSALETPEAGAGDEAGSEPAISIGQEALWFVDRFAPGSPAYSLTMCIALRPKLDPERLDAAFQRVVARHDSLRLSFPADSTGPVPTFLDRTAFKLSVHDVVTRDEQAFRQELDREANRPFDLGEGPLIRLHLYRRPDHDVLLLQVHHIIADAASIAISVEQMLEAYFSMEAGAPVRWSRPALPVATYVSWQQGHVSGTAGKAGVDYWRRQLADAPASLAMPLDFPRPPSQRGPGAARNFTIPKELGQKLKALARSEGQTLFSVLLSAFNVLLYRIGGDNDIVVGTPTLGRLRPEFADAVGYFVNPVPVRTCIDSTDTFKSLIERVSTTVREALEHQEMPFARIVRDLDVPRDPSRSPIFQVMFAMERSAEIDSHGFAATLLNTEGASIAIQGYKIESIAVKRDRAQFDLTFVMEEFGDSIFSVVDYRTDLWKPETIERIVAQYRAILEAIVESSEATIADSPIGQDSGRALMGRALENYPDVIEAIHAAAAKTPNKVAVESTDGRLTYRQLMERMAAIAGALAANGIGDNSLVGLSMGRSNDLLAAVLGVMQVGAAYVPLDPSHPPARLARVLADAAPSIVLADVASAEIVRPLTESPVLLVDSAIGANAASYVRFDKGGYESSELAYVIHTSGSTGGPIGVEVRRDAVSNFLAAMALELPISSDDTLLAVTTVSFDIAVLELLLPLTLGASVVIADDEMLRDSRRLAARLSESDITVMQATPASWQMLIDAGWKGRPTFKALVGGERLQRSLADDILARVGELWNLYGPTETTVWSTCAQIFSEPATASIGRPIANTTCYVVDEHLKAVPVGVPGELLIAGSGLARGYRNKPDQTEARFIRNPFDTSGETRCFRTGDFVRVSQEGALEYIGRRDQQIKIRGFRVELAEIEAALTAHPAVREAAATVQGSDLSHARIAAFAALHSDAQAGETDLIADIRRTLPAYMVPGRIAVVEALPRLPNGKVDRTRLSSMAVVPATTSQVLVHPRNGTEERLVTILKEILEVERISIDDDFFSVGGTSLLAMRYLARASDVFQVSIGPTDLLRAPTVASLAELVASGGLASVADAGKWPANPIEIVNQPVWRPLALARAEGAFGPIEAAAIAYLPDEVVHLPGVQAQLAKMEKVGSGLFWTGVCRLKLGTIALIVAPIGGRDLFTDAKKTRAVIDRSAAYAAQLGARCIALTGLIPAATDLGLSLIAPDGACLTTGHAATATSMGLTIAAVAAAAERDLHDEDVCFVGLGGIGTATLQTLLGCVAHPRALTLCDVLAKRGYLESLAHEIRVTHGFRGEIDIATSSGRLPDKVYQSTFFVGATNAPDVIDVDRLNRGSIVVDDSFPLCFDLQKARRRFESKADILCVAGGSVAPNSAIDWDLALPPGIATMVRDGAALRPPSAAITGCILSSLMPASGLRPTLGAVSLDDCRHYWDGFASLGIKAGPLHCGPWTLTTMDLHRFRSQDQATDPHAARLPHRGAASAVERL